MHTCYYSTQQSQCLRPFRELDSDPIFDLCFVQRAALISTCGDSLIFTIDFCAYFQLVSQPNDMDMLLLFVSSTGERD